MCKSMMHGYFTALQRNASMKHDPDKLSFVITVTQVFKHRCSSSDIYNNAVSHILFVAQNMNNYLSTNLMKRSYLG